MEIGSNADPRPPKRKFTPQNKITGPEAKLEPISNLSSTGSSNKALNPTHVLENLSAPKRSLPRWTPTMPPPRRCARQSRVPIPQPCPFPSFNVPPPPLNPCSTRQLNIPPLVLTPKPKFTPYMVDILCASLNQTCKSNFNISLNEEEVKGFLRKATLYQAQMLVVIKSPCLLALILYHFLVFFLLSQMFFLFLPHQHTHFFLQLCSL